MDLPYPLPASFVVSLTATVRCAVTHALLDDGRAEVVQEDVAFEAHVDDGRVRVVAFPDITGEVETAIGRVKTTVRLDGEPKGSHDAVTGHATVEALLEFDPASFLARTSRVSVRLSTDAHLDGEAGDPLDAGDSRVVLVGEGTFEGGSVDGGHLGLVLDAHVTDWREA